jgi:putative Holliday junction resolvase
MGERRVGLAISDRTRTLARPLVTVRTTPAEAPDRIARQVAQLAAEEDGLSEIVVGLPVRLDGSPNDQTVAVETFVSALRSRTPIPIVTADERLTSREAESRLAVSEPDWRKRKQRIDAVAAAIILQDHLDRTRTS